MKRLFMALAFVASLAPSVSLAQTSCRFVLGFATMAGMVDQVGQCKENQRTVSNGDAQQLTTGGLLVWRKADNWTAFTDGYRTWLNGPNGLQQRLNSERFPWEGASTVQPGLVGGMTSHDWRSPGFVSDVGGTLFDPFCMPLRSVGTNVPNLP